VVDRAASGIHTVGDKVGNAFHEAVAEAPHLLEKAESGAVNAFHTVADMTGIMYDKALPSIGKAYSAYENSVAGKYLIDKKNAFFNAVWAKYGTQIEKGAGVAHNSILGQAIGGALEEGRGIFSTLSVIPVVGDIFGAAAAATGSWHATYTALGELSGDVAPGTGLKELNSNFRDDWTTFGKALAGPLEAAGDSKTATFWQHVEGTSGAVIGTISDPLSKSGELLRDFGGAQAAKAFAKGEDTLAEGLILLGKGGKKLEALGKVQELADKAQKIVSFGDDHGGWSKFWGSMGQTATRLRGYAKSAVETPLLMRLIAAPRTMIGMGVQIPGRILEYLVSGQPRDGEFSGPFDENGLPIPDLLPEDAIRQGATIFVNGILTSYTAHQDRAMQLAKTSKTRVVGIYNASAIEGKLGKLGFVSDLLQCGLDKLSVRGNPATLTLANVIRNYGDHRQPNGRLPIVAHSQGSIIVSEAIREVAIEKRDVTFLNVTTYGNAAWTFPEGPQYDHRVHDSDVVSTLAGSSSLFAAALNSRFLRPIAGYVLGTPLADPRKDTTVHSHYGAFLEPHSAEAYFDEAEDFKQDRRGRGRPIEYGRNLLHTFRALIGMPVQPPAFDVEFRARASRFASSLLQPMKLGPDRSAQDGGSAWPGSILSPRNGRDKIQASGPKSPGSVDGSTLRSTILNADGGGETLSSSVSKKVSGQLGFDASVAKVHRGPAAAMAAERMGAQAFTIGRDIFFSQGAYDPASPKGMALLAHELTHVRQQTAASAPIASAGLGTMEEEAQNAERMVLVRSRRERSSIESVDVEWRLQPADRKTDERYRAALEARAVDLAVEQLDQLGLSGGIENLDVDVELDLEKMGFDEAVQVVCRAIVSSAIRRLSASSVVSSSVIQRDAIDTVKRGVRDFGTMGVADLVLTGLVVGVGAAISAPLWLTLGAGAVFYAVASSKTKAGYVETMNRASEELGHDIERAANPEASPTPTPSPEGEISHAVPLMSHQSPMDAHRPVQLAPGAGGILGLAMSVIAQLFDPSVAAAEAAPLDASPQQTVVPPTPVQPQVPATPPAPAQAEVSTRTSVQAYVKLLHKAQTAEFNAQGRVFESNQAVSNLENQKLFDAQEKKNLQATLKGFQGKRLDPPAKAAKTAAQKKITSLTAEIAKVARDLKAAERTQRKAEAALREVAKERAQRQEEVRLAQARDEINQEFGTDVSWVFLTHQEGYRNDPYVIYNERREVTKEEYERNVAAQASAKKEGKHPASLSSKGKGSEAGKYFAFEPNAKSGVTVGTGVDLAQQNAEHLLSTGVPKELVDKLTPFMKSDVKGAKAVETLNANSLPQLSDAEINYLDREVGRSNLRELIEKYNGTKPATAPQFKDLPGEIQTAMLSGFYNMPIPSYPTFWGHIVNQEWDDVASMLSSPTQFKENKRRRKGEANLFVSGSEESDDPNQMPAYTDPDNLPPGYK